MLCATGCYPNPLQKNAVFIIVMVTIIQNYTSAMSRSRYYKLSRNRAILQHQEQLLSRRSHRLSEHQQRQEVRNRILSFSEIDKEYVRQDITKSHRHSCPSLSQFVHITTIKMCPIRRILDIDVHRLPVALYQVQCKCLHCLGPWDDYITRRCTPLFQFINVLRVIGRKDSGKNIYAQVWEPVSYACSCTEIIKGRIRYVTPP